jgi:DNA-binding NarL/FixJ family response regulator
MPIPIAIIDDHTLFRQGLKELLLRYDHDNKYEVMFEASNGKEMIRQINTGNKPSIILMDINMPEMDGFASVEWLREHHPSIMVAVMSMRSDSESVIKMLKLGVKGYLLKTSDITDLKHALDVLNEKGFFHSEFLSSHLVHLLSDEQEQMSEKQKVLSQLSDNELQFLKMACSEMTYAEIAKKMKLSPKTIDSYRDSLFRKLGVMTRTGLVITAIKLGVVKIE